MIDENKLLIEIKELKEYYDLFYTEGRSDIDDTVKRASDMLFEKVEEIIHDQSKIDIRLSILEPLKGEENDNL